MVREMSEDLPKKTTKILADETFWGAAAPTVPPDYATDEGWDTQQPPYRAALYTEGLSGKQQATNSAQLSTRPVSGRTCLQHIVCTTITPQSEIKLTAFTFRDSYDHRHYSTYSDEQCW